MRIRFPDAWERGVLSDCSYVYSSNHVNKTLYTNWNADELAEKCQGLSGNYLAWYMYGQINKGKTKCLSADGEVPVDDDSSECSSIHLDSSRFS
ncbi:hypothetical protein CRM22_005008, partial [Opisthorchis felineus]